MQMRVVGNVWLSGRAYGFGEVLDLPEPEAERLAVLGVAEPVSAAQPQPAQQPVEMPETAEAVDLQPAPEMVEMLEPAEAPEMAEPVSAEPSQPAPEPAKPKRKRGKR